MLACVTPLDFNSRFDDRRFEAHQRQFGAIDSVVQRGDGESASAVRDGGDLTSGPLIPQDTVTPGSGVILHRGKDRCPPDRRASRRIFG
jgi:hypothetical protein